MSWVDDDSYFGPDRRRERSLRLLERRRRDCALPTPSLGVLLRKLQVRAGDLNTGDGASVSRYLTHIRSVADLARVRGQACAEASLRALEEVLQAPGGELRELANQHLQSALAALR